MDKELVWMDGKCEDCEYGIPFVDGQGNQIYIECWRFPPAMHVVPPHKGPFINYHTKHPQVESYDKCGEYKYVKRLPREQ